MFLALGASALAACAGTAPHVVVTPPRGDRAASVSDLAALVGAAHVTRGAGGRAVVQHASGDRIVLYPGTTVAAVREAPIDLGSPAWESDGEVWLLAHDAAVLLEAWEAGAARDPVPRRDPPPSPPRASRGALPPPPSKAAPRTAAPAAGQPSERERGSWAVPLRRRWRSIIIHHSASRRGSAAQIDRWHRQRGWDGLGYDFVIGNGRGSRDGQVEVGYRWRQQLDGAHAKQPWNRTAIGICLVGDFTRGPPSAAQLRALTRLCNFLQDYCAIPTSEVRFHREVGKTVCPGPHFPARFRDGL